MSPSRGQKPISSRRLALLAAAAVAAAAAAAEFLLLGSFGRGVLWLGSSFSAALFSSIAAASASASVARGRPAGPGRAQRNGSARGPPTQPRRDEPAALPVAARPPSSGLFSSPSNGAAGRSSSKEEAGEEDVDRRLRWPTAEEELQVKGLWERLSAEESAQLAACPPDIRHLVFLTRFLRGLSSEELAFERLREMLAYRREHAETIARSRSLIAEGTSEFDMSLVMHGDFWTECVRFVSHGTSDDCYVEVVFVRHADFDRFLAWPVEQIVELVVSVLELYSVVLHNQSLKSHRMCQICFVEDACGFPVSMLTSPWSWVRQTSAILPIAKCYPEIVHRAVLFNAPKAVAAFVSMFERVGKYWFKSWFPGQVDDEEIDFQMSKYDGKLLVLPAGEWQRLAGSVTVRVLEQWAANVAPVDGEVRAGLVAARGSWLERGEALEWHGTADRGDLRALFFTPAGAAQAAESFWEEVAEGHGSGRFVARDSGLFVLTLDNTQSWSTPAKVSLELWDDGDS